MRTSRIALSPDDFRRGLSNFASGVTVVTTRDEWPAGRAGLTASAFTSVSLVPPLILVRVAQNAQSYPALRDSKGSRSISWADGQEGISTPLRVLRQGTSAGEVRRHPPPGRHPGFPLLEGALAHLECPDCPRVPRRRSHDLRRAGRGGAAEGDPAVRATALLPRGAHGRTLAAGLLMSGGLTHPLSRPPVDDEIKAAVLEAVDSRQYILGPECQRASSRSSRATTGSSHAGPHQQRDRRRSGWCCAALEVKAGRRGPRALAHRASPPSRRCFARRDAGLRRRRRRHVHRSTSARREPRRWSAA